MEEICINIKEKNEEATFQELSDIVEQQKQNTFEIIPQVTYVHFDKEQTTTHQEQRQEHQKMENYTMLTTEGKLIAKVLGEMPIELKKYNNLKFSIKHKQNKVGNHVILDLLVPLQTKVLKKISELEKEVEYWEKLYFMNNNFSAPVMNDRIKDTLHLDKFNRTKMGEKLKQYWNINF